MNTIEQRRAAMTPQERRDEIAKLTAFANDYLDQASRAWWGRRDKERIAGAAFTAIAAIRRSGPVAD